MLTDTELDSFNALLQRGQFTSAHLLQMVLLIRAQQRVLHHLFDLFYDIDKLGGNLRHRTDSIRTANLDALKKEVGIETNTPTHE